MLNQASAQNWYVVLRLPLLRVSRFPCLPTLTEVDLGLRLRRLRTPIVPLLHFNCFVAK